MPHRAARHDPDLQVKPPSEVPRELALQRVAPGTPGDARSSFEITIPPLLLRMQFTGGSFEEAASKMPPRGGSFEGAASRRQP